MKPDQIASWGDALYQALRSRTPLDPLTAAHPALTVAEAYSISLRTLALRLEAGERVVGKKIGATSKAVQQRFGVDQPDFGYLTNAMVVESGDSIVVEDRLIQPMVEGELGFILHRDLQGPGITALDVLGATESVVACIEVIDSRIRNWKVKIQDTVADNASSGLVVVSNQRIRLQDLDLETVGMVVRKNGEIISTGTGAAVLGSPARCVAWLANALAEFGHGLRAGELVLSGSFVAVEPVRKGDHVDVRIGGVGSVGVRFA